MAKRKRWPVVRHYHQDHLARIAMPLGGIGTGCVSLGGRGDLHDWEIMNRPAKGFTHVIWRTQLPQRKGREVRNHDQVQRRPSMTVTSAGKEQK